MIPKSEDFILSVLPQGWHKGGLGSPRPSEKLPQLLRAGLKVSFTRLFLESENKMMTDQTRFLNGRKSTLESVVVFVVCPLSRPEGDLELPRRCINTALL
jgi:hypothetical protein